MKLGIPDQPMRDELLGRLGTVARNAWSDDASPGEHEAGRALFKAAVVRSQSRRGGAVRAFAFAALLCSAVVAFLLWPSDLKYTVASAAPSADGYLQAPVGGAPAVAHFTDGTEVRIAAGGRARVVDVTRHGARIALEQGHAALSVVHRDGARWSVDAGPFSVAVTGTEFDVDWSGSEGVLVVELRRGSVIVSGPLAPNGVGLAAGQRLVANLGEGRLHLEPLSAPLPPVAAAPPSEHSAASPLAPNPPGAIVDAPEPAAASEPAEPAAHVVAEVAPRSWTKRVAAGDFSGVLADADAAGEPRLLASAPAANLVALGDAARYTGNIGVAKDALTALRKRFPGSLDAKSAAFLLGRLADGSGAESEALGWYRRYLDEAPHGAFVAEALGRQILVTRKLDGSDAARTLAQSYLTRFPNGPYAKAATELVESH